MTTSLFVTGELAATDTFLVDIGTGYYVEKNGKDAEAYYNRKLKLLEESEQHLANALGQRRKNLEMVIGTLQQRMRQQQQQAQAV